MDALNEKYSEQEINELFKEVPHNHEDAEKIGYSDYSYWKSVFQNFLKNKPAVILLCMFIVLVCFSFIALKVGKYGLDMRIDSNNAFIKPNGEFWFGTDNIGNSVFDAVWSGARNSIIVSFICTAINMVLGIVVGAIWGFSKKMDKWMIEVYNVISNVPFLLLAMILTYVLGSGFKPLIFTMTVTDWIFVAYFIRTQVMIIRDREYNLASKCLGTPTWTIITKNILPYLISVIMTYVSREIPSIISYEVFLSYMGLGLSSEYASLGKIISTYTSFMNGYPHLFWIPVGILAIISISLYIVGQRLADAADPRTHM